MKAVLRREYGSADLLEIVDIPRPTVEDDEVLVKVQAAGVNPLDWRSMRADPVLIRLALGWRRPKHPQLGADFSGSVEQVGSKVSTVQIGDKVFGAMPDDRLGSFAEFAVVPEQELARAPENISLESAAAIPTAGRTALQGLNRLGKLSGGETVLINGASGGVGTFAVQIAKGIGANVTGVCSARNLDLVRSLGAQEVLDYGSTDFTKTGDQYDLVFDTVGNISGAALKRTLKPNGRAIVAGFSTFSRLLATISFGLVNSFLDTKQIKVLTLKRSRQDLVDLKVLVERGIVSPKIDRRYCLSDAADAIRYLETRRAQGKVILHVNSNKTRPN